MGGNADTPPSPLQHTTAAEGDPVTQHWAPALDFQPMITTTHNLVTKTSSHTGRVGGTRSDATLLVMEPKLPTASSATLLLQFDPKPVRTGHLGLRPQIRGLRDCQYQMLSSKAANITGMSQAITPLRQVSRCLVNKMTRLSILVRL